MINPDNIKNIIFDLGGVVINLDIGLTVEKFRSLGLADVENYFTQFNQTGLFDKLDKGRISGEEFIAQLNALFPEPPGEQVLIEAWNSMILDFPSARATLMRELKSRYRTFLLSNTNEIHLNTFFKNLQESYRVGDMSSFVHRAYYSCLIDMRKPDREIFEKVINENGLIPSETLFIDDSPQHVESARKTGLIAHHLTEKEGILEILKGF